MPRFSDSDFLLSDADVDISVVFEACSEIHRYVLHFAQQEIQLRAFGARHQYPALAILALLLVAEFWEHKKERLREWWNAPISRSYRVVSLLMGLWAGIWISGLGRVFYETPVSLSIIGEFALFGGVFGAIMGVAFPKASRFVSLPFMFMGIGCSGG